MFKKIQSKLQTFAGAMMVPIILLVLVGFYVGIGSAFTNYILPEGNFIDIGPKNDLENYAREIYSALRKADKLKPKIILIEGVKKEGIGIAIMNRLLRATSYDVLE